MIDLFTYEEDNNSKSNMIANFYLSGWYYAYSSFHISGMNSIENESSLLNCVFDKLHQYPVWFFLQ